MTWFCVSKIFGPVGPEKMVICDRSAFAERSCRGRTKGRKARMSARPMPFMALGWDLCKIEKTLSVCPPGRQLSQRESQIRRTCGADGGTGNPSPTTLSVTASPCHHLPPTATPLTLLTQCHPPKGEARSAAALPRAAGDRRSPLLPPGLRPTPLEEGGTLSVSLTLIL